MRRIVGCLILLVTPLMVFARTYRLEGNISAQYPIVIELEEHEDGLFSGRYVYQSTLRKNGNVDCSWLDINPSYDNPTTQWDIRDCQLNPVETWYNVKFTNGKRLTCKLKNKKGIIYDVIANVTMSSQDSPSTLSYFKSHIGESVSDFGMFYDPSIQQRFEEMMGINNFNYLTYIYQTQGGIEYTKSMYWGSGFMAHQCCDPAAVWAYDTDNNSFYAWIRKDGKDFWWSESGSVPYKFKELVNRTF